MKRFCGWCGKTHDTVVDPCIEGKEVAQQFDMFLSKIRRGICPMCDDPMTTYQVGPCVYADPCRHRLYQGIIELGEVENSPESV